MIHAPSALQRCQILLGLRLRLLFRSRSAKPVAFAFTLAVNFVLLLVAALFAVGTAFGVSRNPELGDSLLASAFGSIFIAQCVLTLVGMAVSEFFDVGRIMHLPVAAKEVFAAMLLAGMISVMTPLYAASPLGVMVAQGGGAFVMLGRLLCVFAALALGHLVSLAIFFLMSTAMTRRRMRDFAVVLGSFVGISAYVGFRLLDVNYIEPGRMQELAQMKAPAFFTWLPTAGLLDIWRGEFGGLASLRIGFTLLTGVLAFRFGAARLQRMLDGEAEPPSTAPVMNSESVEVPFLSPIVGAGFLLHLRLLWRDPQLRMQWLQQVVFICLPWVFMGVRTDGDEQNPWFVWWLPAMFVLARAGFHHGLFGADGKGLTLLMLSPAPRTQLVAGRMLAVLGMCIPIDLVLAALLLLLLGTLGGDPLCMLYAWPAVALGVVIFHTLAVAVGAVFSTRWPYPIASADRKRAVKAGQGQGCVTTFVKLFCFLPELAVSGLLTALALAPLMDFPWVGRLLPSWSFALTLPAVLAVCALLAVAGCIIGARTLEQREEQFLQALRETGD
ncbi:MAG: hypothetical protein EXS14_07785 [Planctomycetes bacterium]|nr:hypothetical protein [Planctomycetota bacterium]